MDGAPGAPRARSSAIRETRRGIREYPAIGVFIFYVSDARAIADRDRRVRVRASRVIDATRFERARDRSSERDARSRARARALAPFQHTRSTMSALLASSFVGRVAAFKATKIQVRIF